MRRGMCRVARPCTRLLPSTPLFPSPSPPPPLPFFSSRGGETRFTHCGAHKGMNGADFYDAPGPLDASEDAGFSWKAKHYDEVSIRPERGLAVVHFPSLLPEYGGRGDGNAFHLASPAVDEKFICQQFIYSGPCWQSGDKDTPRARLSPSVC